MVMTPITDTNIRALETTTHLETGDIIIVIRTRSVIRHGEWERSSVRITQNELAALANLYLDGKEQPSDNGNE